MLFPEDMLVAFRLAVAEFERVEALLKSYEKMYRGIGEWDCFPVANELRYAGQHLCRWLLLTEEAPRTKEIETLRNIEMCRAEGHCRQAAHDAHDYLILFYVLHIQWALIQGGGGSLPEISGIRRSFLNTCLELAKLRRTDNNFREARKEMIARLESIFLVVMSGNERESDAVVLIPKRHEKKVENYNESPTVKEIVEMFNKTEDYLKMFELIRGKASSHHIRLLFGAARYLVLDNDTKKFSEACSVTIGDILLRMLIFLMRSTGEDGSVVQNTYEIAFSKGFSYSEIEGDHSLLADVMFYLEKWVTTEAIR